MLRNRLIFDEWEKQQRWKNDTTRRNIEDWGHLQKRRSSKETSKIITPFGRFVEEKSSFFSRLGTRVRRRRLIGPPRGMYAAAIISPCLRHWLYGWNASNKTFKRQSRSFNWRKKMWIDRWKIPANTIRMMDGRKKNNPIVTQNPMLFLFSLTKKNPAQYTDYRLKNQIAVHSARDQ